MSKNCISVQLYKKKSDELIFADIPQSRPHVMSLLLFQDLTNSLSLHYNTWFAHTFIEFIQQTVWEHLDPAQCFNNDLDVIGDKASWSETTEKYWPSLWSIYNNILSWETGHTVRSQGVWGLDSHRWKQFWEHPQKWTLNPHFIFPQCLWWWCRPAVRSAQPKSIDSTLHVEKLPDTSIK